MSIKPVHQKFDELLRRVYTPELIAELKPENIDELRRIYFAGFHDMFQVVVSLETMKDEVAAQNLVTTIRNELGAFFASLNAPPKG